MDSPAFPPSASTAPVHLDYLLNVVEARARDMRRTDEEWRTGVVAPPFRPRPAAVLERRARRRTTRTEPRQLLLFEPSDVLRCKHRRMVIAAATEPGHQVHSCDRCQAQVVVASDAAAADARRPEEPPAPSTVASVSPATATPSPTTLPELTDMPWASPGDVVELHSSPPGGGLPWAQPEDVLEVAA